MKGKENTVKKVTWLLDSVRDRESERVVVGVVENEHGWVSVTNDSQNEWRKVYMVTGNDGMMPHVCMIWLFKVNAL